MLNKFKLSLSFRYIKKMQFDLLLINNESILNIYFQ